MYIKQELWMVLVDVSLSFSCIWLLWKLKIWGKVGLNINERIFIIISVFSICWYLFPVCFFIWLMRFNWNKSDFCFSKSALKLLIIRAVLSRRSWWLNWCCYKRINCINFLVYNWNWEWILYLFIIFTLLWFEWVND